jgi:NitT/TauT family transport system permease protein
MSDTSEVRPVLRRYALNSKIAAVIEEKPAFHTRLYERAWVRSGALLAVTALVWEIYGRVLDSPYLFPPFSETVAALVTDIFYNGLLYATLASIRVLLIGYAAGLALAFLLTLFASATQIGQDFLRTFTSMFSPLPAIALLPLSLLWFGLGDGSLIFVLVHSVLWPVALNTFSGFTSVSNTLRMVGRNYGLGGLRYIFLILIPAAFPSILTGLKIGWAFAWRTLIAAELIFGVSSSSAGLGWFIYSSKNQLNIPSVFGGLLMVILVGLFVESLIFQTIERHTVRKWGMQL